MNPDLEKKFLRLSEIIDNAMNSSVELVSFVEELKKEGTDMHLELCVMVHLKDSEKMSVEEESQRDANFLKALRISA